MSLLRSPHRQQVRQSELQEHSPPYPLCPVDLLEQGEGLEEQNAIPLVSSVERYVARLLKMPSPPSDVTRLGRCRRRALCVGVPAEVIRGAPQHCLAC